MVEVHEAVAPLEPPTALAAVARTGPGRYKNVSEAIAAMSGFIEDVMPEPALRTIYDDLAPVFDTARAARRLVGRLLPKGVS